MKTQIAIVGGGPAGAAAGLALARLGLQACVIEPGGREKAGECLYPRAAPLLSRIGLFDPAAEGHRASPGMRIVWGGAVADRDFIAHPNGVGWNLDRAKFEAGLRGRATEAGALWIEGRLIAVAPDGPPFRFVVAANEGEMIVEPEVVVDASGRIACFARRRGAKRRMEDRLIAVHARYDGVFNDPRLLVEEAEAGWWYSAALSNCLIASYQSAAPDPLPAPPPMTAARLAGLTSTSTARFAAGSSRLDRLAGEGWLAIGDAAAAHDPLSGHGISAALSSAFDGADAVAAWLGGDRDALARHARIRGAAWIVYRDGLAQQYAAAGLALKRRAEAVQ